MRRAHALAAAGAALWLSAPASAADADQMEALLQALKIPETVEVLQEEGAVFGQELASDMIPDVGEEVWAQVLERIYDGDKMYAVLANGFETTLEDADLAPMLAYFESDDAQEIVTLELSARRAFLSRETEEFAKAQFRKAEDSESELARQVNTLIADSDLVEMNVTGALNSDLMFYSGLNEGGAFDLSEEEILTDVWAGEEELRASSREWLQAFLMMAYQPLDTKVIDDYAAFWRTEAGQELNRAIFVAFDDMYEDISYLLGLAIAEQMTIEEL